MGFLQRFGYLDSPTVNNSEALFQETAVVEAISRMQRFGGLNPTGKIDNDTLKVSQTKIHLMLMNMLLVCFLIKIKSVQ